VLIYIRRLPPPCVRTECAAREREWERRWGDGWIRESLDEEQTRGLLLKAVAKSDFKM